MFPYQLQGNAKPLQKTNPRPLTYVTAAGSPAILTPPNPLEAFAVAGSIFYARPQGMSLPAWPEYWAWFSQNLG